MRTTAAALVALTLAVGSCADGPGAGPTATAPGPAPGTQPDTSAPPTSPSPSRVAPSTTAATAPPSTSVPRERRVVAERIDVPWSLAFLPDGSALVTTRDRAELLLVREGSRPVVLGRVPGVDPGGEGGLLGAAVSPDFTTDRTVFLYLTAAEDNRVVRVTLTGGRVGAPQPVLTGIPKARNHNGGRLAFGPDGHLYVATGDAGDGSRSQDRRSLAGKILRVSREGRPAPGNPFPGSPVWSLGHRNVQGLAWDGDGRMYASEFGQNTWDELNLVRPGANYGWPQVEGRAGRRGLVDPLRQWRTDEASPSGIAVTADGTIYMAALRGESLWRIPARGGVVGQPARLLRGAYGRLRDVVVAPDGRLWVLTNNTARGNPSADDDRVLAIPEATLR